jgi:hypothetical protein
MTNTLEYREQVVNLMSQNRGININKTNAVKFDEYSYEVIGL